MKGSNSGKRKAVDSPHVLVEKAIALADNLTVSAERGPILSVLTELRNSLSQWQVIPVI